MYSSTILSFRVKGSPPFPSGNHSHPHYDRFDRYGLPFPAPAPSCCCSCCCCCSCSYGHCNSSHRVPSSTSFLYGLRQSSLLQRSASRTLILNGRDRSYNRCPDYGVDREVSCVSRDRVEKGRKLGSRRKIVCRISEESSEVPELSRYEDDAESLLSLLCENIELDSSFGKNRRGSSSMRVEVEKRKTYGTEISKSRKKNVGSNSNASKGHESVSVRSSRGGNVRRKDREEELLRLENPKRTCSCSSYYTVSSAGDFESDTVEIKDDKLSEFEYSEETRIREEGKIRRERVQESKKRYEDVKESEFSQKRDSAVKSNAEWDWRKKSEKKLNEVSIGEVESNKQDSRITRSHGYDESKASSSHKRFTVEDGKLNMESRVELKSNSQAASESFVESRRQQRTEVCTVCGSGVILSSSQPVERLARREESRIASSSGVRDDERRAAAKYPQQHSGTLRIQEIDSEDTSAKYTQKHSGTLRIQEIDSEDTSAKYPQKHSEALRIHEIDSQNISAVHRESDTRVSKSEQQNTNVASTSSYKEQQNTQRDEQIRRQSDVRKSSTTSVETRQNIESTYVSNEKHLEENKNSVSYSYPSPREQYPLTTQQSSIIQNKSSIEKERVAYSQRTSEEKASDRNSNITLVVNLGEGVSRNQEQTTQEVAQKEDERRTNVFSSPLTISEVSLSTNQTVNFIQQEQKQFNVYKGASTSTPVVPPSQLGTGESEYTQRRNGKEVEVQGSSPGRVLAQDTHIGAADPVFEFVGGSRKDEITETTLQHKNDEDALGSAHRSEQLSSQFIGEFIQKASSDIVSSQTKTSITGTDIFSQDQIQTQTQTGSIQQGVEVQLEGNTTSSDIVSSQTKTSIKGTNIVSQGQIQNQTQTSSIQHGVEVQLEGNPSGGSVAKGPSEEKWLVTDSTAEQSFEATHSTAPGGKIVKRTGKSLWAMISDIVRLRWGHETPHSAAQPGKKRPSFESTASEAYFSGRDHDEKGSTPVEATPSEMFQTGQGFSETQTEVSSKHFEEPLSRPVTPGSTTSTPTSSVIMQDAFGWHHEDDSAPLVESSSHPEALTGKVIPGLEATSVTSERIVSPGGSMEMTEQPGGGELKQRKLQRNKQVLKDRFEEWEEAYVVESEQRKMDETFMREALIEAKKAADNWEVPVGAVLVQDGKIIARGCNLVEELRDSTAHAEMICIREASNILRAWRLSGTTLYVTLEPCPMCAGAILQARVDTLVWGAPNKLLGADGSWIKLFRDGEEGESSETSEKPQPPVHPFHPKMTIRRGVLASECADTMQQFFQLRRRNKAKQERPLTPPSCLPVSPNPAKLLRNIFHMPFCL